MTLDRPGVGIASTYPLRIMSERRLSRGSCLGRLMRRGMRGFIDAELPASGQRHTDESAPSLVTDIAAVHAQLGHRCSEAFDVVTHKKQFLSAAGLGRMYRKLRWRKCEDQPVMAGGDERKSEHVAQESTVGFGIAAVEHKMGSGDHQPTLPTEDRRPPDRSRSDWIRRSASPSHSV